MRGSVKYNESILLYRAHILLIQYFDCANSINSTLVQHIVGVFIFYFRSVFSAIGGYCFREASFVGGPMKRTCCCPPNLRTSDTRSKVIILRLIYNLVQ